jgi:hypothetical protein
MPATTPCVPCGSTSQTVNVPGTPGLSAYAVVTSPFIIPAVNSNVTVSVNQTSSFVEGQNVFVGVSSATGANFSVYSVNTPYSVTLQFLGFAGDLAVGTTIPVNYLVVPGTGNVLSLSTVGFATTTAPFTLGTPFTGSLTINVSSAAPFQVGQNIFIGTGTSQINAKIGALSVSNKTLTIIPLGFPGDLLSGTIVSGALVVSGVGGDFSFGTATVLAQAFTIPSANTSGTAYVSNFNSIGAGGPQYVVIYSQAMQTAKYATFLVTVSTSSSSQLTLTPLLLPGDSQSGAFPVGSIVIPIGTPAQGFGPGITADPTGTKMAIYATANAGSGFTIAVAPGGNVTIGSTLIQITLPLAGTYVIFGWFNINGVGSTFPVTGSGVSNIIIGITGSPASSFGGGTATVRPRVGASTAATTQSGTWEASMISPATWVVTGATTCTMTALIDTEPTAGTVEIIQAELFAIKIA